MIAGGRETLRCLDCGKCTGSCPVARHSHTLSPRRLVRDLAHQDSGNPNDAIWDCLTCMQCDMRCPQKVPVAAVLPELRRQARARAEGPRLTRCSAMDSVSVLQSRNGASQNRLDWLTDDLQTDPGSKVLLWIGCTPYFDAFFGHNGVRTLDGVKSALRILNALGIRPAVRGDERCCGHDQLWGGDQETFAQLANRNVRLFTEAEPELVVTVCPECQLTLINEYQRRFGQPACPVVHLAELVADRGQDLRLDGRLDTVTFNDPCRLGRHQQKYDPPRNALQSVPGLVLQEMPRNRASAVCCAGNWKACSQVSKRIQTDLLKAAAATGADYLVTACPKCLVHLKCAQAGDDPSVPGIEIRDLATVVAGALTHDEPVPVRAPVRAATERGGKQ
jgi:heterodisulfide reductase subunit D